MKEYRLTFDRKLHYLLEKISDLSRTEIIDEYDFATACITAAIKVAQQQYQDDNDYCFDWYNSSDFLNHTPRGYFRSGGNTKAIILKDNESAFIRKFQMEAEEYFRNTNHRINFSFLIKHLLANFILASKASLYESTHDFSSTADCKIMSEPETSAALTRLLLKKRDDNDNAVLKQIQTLLISWENRLSASQEFPSTDREI